MLDTLKFFGLMFFITAPLTAGTTFLVDKAFGWPNWVKWLLMPLMMLAYSIVAVYISDWLLVVRKVGKAVENQQMEHGNEGDTGQDVGDKKLGPGRAVLSINCERKRKAKDGRS